MNFSHHDSRPESRLDHSLIISFFLDFFSLLTYLFICVQRLNDREERGGDAEKDTERERERIFHLLIHSLSVSNSWGQIRFKSRARNSISISCWMAGVHALDFSCYCCCCFLKHVLAASCTGTRVAAPVWNADAPTVANLQYPSLSFLDPLI